MEKYLRMSKKYKGKPCAYCAGLSTTADHVWAREFFTIGDRSKLRKVPACERCNNAKSKLEHELTAVLPFGARHADAVVMVSEYMPQRLAKNAKLHRQLSAGYLSGWLDNGSGIIVPTVGLPLDSRKLADLFVYVAKGLFLLSWKYVVPKEAIVRAGMVNSCGAQNFEQILAQDGQRVSGALGNSVLAFEGLRSKSEPHITIWKFTPYGGVQMGGDPRAPQETPKDIWVTIGTHTAPLMPEEE